MSWETTKENLSFYQPQIGAHPPRGHRWGWSRNRDPKARSQYQDAVSSEAGHRGSSLDRLCRRVPKATRYSRALPGPAFSL